MDLQEISALASAMVETEKEIEQQETVLSQLKERLRSIKEESLPMGMQELGLESFKLSTGETLSVKQEVYASIPVAQKTTAFKWLEDHGFGGLIKTEVATSFGKGDMELAKRAVQLLSDNGFEASLSQNVHAQTLKAWLKECLEKGVDVPLETFGARPCWTTVLKKAKQ